MKEIVTVDVEAPAAVLDDIRIPAGILVVVHGDHLRVTGDREHLRKELNAAGLPPVQLEQAMNGARHATLGHAYGLGQFAPSGEPTHSHAGDDVDEHADADD
jgi:hypothetical protein